MILELLAWSAASSASAHASEANNRTVALQAQLSALRNGGGLPIFIKLTHHEIQSEQESTGFLTVKIVGRLVPKSEDHINIGNIKEISTGQEGELTYTQVKTYTGETLYSDKTPDEIRALIRQAVLDTANSVKEIFS
jgi:hypothetical protein